MVVDRLYLKQAYKCVEDGARKVIMECKGSISHHHGVGKLRKDFMPDALGTTGEVHSIPATRLLSFYYSNLV